MAPLERSFWKQRSYRLLDKLFCEGKAEEEDSDRESEPECEFESDSQL